MHIKRVFIFISSFMNITANLGFEKKDASLNKNLQRYHGYKANEETYKCTNLKPEIKINQKVLLSSPH